MVRTRVPESSSKYDFPVGTYDVVFKGVEEKEFEAGKFGTGGLRWVWKFLIESPNEFRGKIIDQVTGTDPVLKSKCLALLSGLAGRALKVNDEVDTDHYIGRRYRLTWTPNPDSEKGNSHISSLTPISASAGNSPSPAPSGPPPRPAKAPPQPPLEELYWIDPWGKDKPETWTLDAIKAHVETNHLDPAQVEVCKVGTRTWVTVASLGVEDKIPF